MVDNGELTLQKRLGLNIATRRKALGWTQEYLAQHMGVDTETISRFERGVTAPSLKSIEKLAGLLTITIADLLSESTPPEPTQMEALSRLLEPLVDEDKSYVMTTLRSLCFHLSALRSRGKD
jgi:transcriptional regulator with XRE-family HTH domain